MSDADFAFAVDLTRKMGWDLSEQDFQFMIELEPKGCLILLEDDERIGLATSVRFGKIGWFGNLSVSEGRRNRGAGSLLVKYAVDYLTGEGAETVGLYAYMERIPFYRRLGFQSDIDFTVMKGKGQTMPAEGNVREATETEVDDIVALDEACFGDSRRKLLKPILEDKDNLCFISTDKGRILGYIVAKVFRGQAEIGPMICSRDQSEIPLNLLKTMLNRLGDVDASMFIPENDHAMHAFLTEAGFRQSFKVQRMFYGLPAAKECVRMAESLERG